MLSPNDLGLFLGEGQVGVAGARRQDEPAFDPACCDGSDVAPPTERMRARPPAPSGSEPLVSAQPRPPSPVPQA